MESHRPHTAGGCCCTAAAGVRQTVDEMDFERGIWSAALDGDLSRVRSLIQKGADPNLPDNFGYTALHYSSRKGSLPVCSFLLDNGANSNAQTHGGTTALHRAAYRGHFEVVQLLLEHGADPAKTDSDGRTALHKAAEGGHHKLCQLLLKQNGKLMELKDSRGQTASDLYPPVLNGLVPP
ncbi:hypothetical protein GDO86_006616 [Hymenochirus boettgeri]|uniref:Ankyrin repeat domain 39 n=1 Tax=Hymenochirus boettgeri TaxID=247094 RepID=A0A8T2JB80_9PIPI|nr:hypothetical protein GDO86_006616 [Hymenochirus boettgeri]